MAGLVVRDTRDALVVFTDIVDSSKFSAVLDPVDYANRVLEFQEAFQRLGERYFPQPADKSQSYTSVIARGDEGVVFLIDDRVGAPEMILRAIEFVFHLKGYLKLAAKETEVNLCAPLQIGLGAGIHYGRVAFATEVRDGHSEIARIEGFSINYGKRVESSSRAGECSRVMLSKEAVRLLEGAPIVFSRKTAVMKGIDEQAEVYEVCGGLFSGLNLDPEADPRDERLISQARKLAAEPYSIGEPWMKSLIISILDILIAKYPLSAQKAQCREAQYALAWHSCFEDDPILLYLRARMFAERSEYTQQLRYLRDIVQRHPGFVHARKDMIEACSAIAKGGSEPAERIFARDLAKEFLERFPELLSPTERKTFKAIIAEASNHTRRRRVSRGA